MENENKDVAEETKKENKEEIKEEIKEATKEERSLDRTWNLSSTPGSLRSWSFLLSLSFPVSDIGK